MSLGDEGTVPGCLAESSAGRWHCEDRVDPEGCDTATNCGMEPTHCDVELRPVEELKLEKKK